MKHNLIAYLSLFLSFLSFKQVYSQNYQPFLADEIYLYETWYTNYDRTDSIKGVYSLRIDSIRVL
ncbi:MAG: hypothetical protein AAFR87_06970 [Bacteroidota bacterium]